MEVQFTPWRRAYIKEDTATPRDGCVLCDLGQQAPSEESLVLYRGSTCYVVMNRYPYNTGHLMVVPYLHTADLPVLPDTTAAELFALTRHSVALLKHALAPHGFNLGMNLGKIAGAGIDEHLHMHIVPRWGGDMNFLPIIGGVKLIPEALEQTYGQLRPAFDALGDAHA